ncbi:MAG: hypothetical protein MSA07_09730 [Mucispirillum sp.]|nr:hypothetical protein [Mucispirillum sp.]
MIKAENILQKRIEYFKNKEYEKIYDIYSLESEFRRYFENKEIYKEHFEKLIDTLVPESVEIYKVLYNNERAEILFLEKLRDLKEDKLINCYSKSYLVLENGSWKILKEIRESTLNKGV